MRFRIAATVLIATVLALGGSAFADGTLTGSVGGTVRDIEGGPLPGVVVTLTGVKTNLKRSVVSGSNGAYSLPLLPIGDYKVEVGLSGFQSVTSTVSVYTNRNTQFDASLKLASVAESVAVTAELPVVDKENTTSATTVNANFTQKLAVGRSYQSLLQMAPGVTGGSNPNVRGALSSSNLYLFDGVDTTDTATGTFGQNFNYEAIQEVAVNTGNYSAEFGRATGAIVQVVTKSGSNAFHGSAKFIATNDDWNAQNSTYNEVTGASLARTKVDSLQDRYALTLGGPVVKDHLWFFGAYEFYNTETQTQTLYTGEPYADGRDAKIWNGKINWAITSNHSLEVSANGDPIDAIVNDYWGASGEREALTSQSQGGEVYRGAWTGLFSANLSAEATFATASNRIDVLPFETPAAAPKYRFGTQTVTVAERLATHYDLDKGYYFNGATFDGFVERPRTQANLAMNLYQQFGSSNHNFKAGIDFQDLSSDAQFAYPDNTVYYDYAFDAATREFEPFEKQVFDPPQVSSSTGTIWGFYLLDRINWGRFFFNVGFRIDKQEGKSDVGSTVFDTTTIAPRFAFKYDVTGKGKTLVSGGYGRFYQSLIQSFADNYANVPQQSNYNDYLFNYDTGVWDFAGRVTAAGNTLPINGDLKPVYTDDFTVAFEQQLGSVFGVSFRGNYRKWNDLIDDVRTFNSSTGARSINYVNYDPASRKYTGFEVVFDKRYASNWQAYVSYTYGKTEGNHFSDFASVLGDYLDSPATRTVGGVTETRTGAYVNEGNRDGRASYDRTHDIKGYGAYTFNWGRFTLVPATTLGWRSGYTSQRQETGWRIAGGTYTRYSTERGSDRYPDQFYMDFALEATFRIVGDFALGLKGEAFNLTDTQTKLAGGQTDNPNYMKATSRSQYASPRAYRLTALFTF